MEALENLMMEGLQAMEAAPPPNFEEPGYLKPTFSSHATSYLHEEVERVSNSYRCGSYWSLKKLPNKIEPGKIRSLRLKQTNDNLSSKPDGAFFVRSVSAKSLFPPMTYIGTDYHKQEDMHRQAIEENRMRLEGNSKKPFMPSSCRIKDRYEDIFDDIGYKFPYMGPGQGVPQLQNMLRANENDVSLHSSTSGSQQQQGSVTSSVARQKSDGPFLPDVSYDNFPHESLMFSESPPKDPKPSNDKDYYNYNAKEWAQRIYTALSSDWPHQKFKLKFAGEGELLVQFDISAQHIEANRDVSSDEGLNVISQALHGYMNQMITHGIAAEHNLTRRGDRWGVVEMDAFRSTKKHSNKKSLRKVDVQAVTGSAGGGGELESSQLGDSITPDAEFGTNREDLDIPVRIPLLTYSMYAPWVKSGGLTVKREMARSDRVLARKTDEDLRLRAADLTRAQEIETFGVTVKDMKRDVRLSLISTQSGDAQNGMDGAPMIGNPSSSNMLISNVSNGNLLGNSNINNNGNGSNINNISSSNNLLSNLGDHRSGNRLGPRGANLSPLQSKLLPRMGTTAPLSPTTGGQGPPVIGGGANSDVFLEGRISLSQKSMLKPQIAANIKMAPKPIPLPGQPIDRWSMF